MVGLWSREDGIGVGLSAIRDVAIVFINNFTLISPSVLLITEQDCHCSIDQAFSTSGPRQQVGLRSSFSGPRSQWYYQIIRLDYCYFNYCYYYFVIYECSYLLLHKNSHLKCQIKCRISMTSNVGLDHTLLELT